LKSQLCYAFTDSIIFSGPAYPSVREALNWARGDVLHIVEMSGKWTECKGGFLAQEMLPLLSKDATPILQHFARRSAFAGMKTFSGKHLTESLEGLYYWLHWGKVSQSSWENLRDWAEDNEMLWMNGGHIEAAACNAILSYIPDREPHYHAWLAGQHIKMQFGKAEIARQEKSLKQSVTKMFGEMK